MSPTEWPILMTGWSMQRILRGVKFQTRRMNRDLLKRRAGDVLWCREKWASPEVDKTIPGRVAYDADGVCGCWIGGGEDLHFICHGRIIGASGTHDCWPAEGATSRGLGQYSDLRSGEYPSYKYGWRPAMHMPRWACRQRIRLTADPYLEPVQHISAADAVAEGCESCTPYDEYRAVWEQINGKKPEHCWAANPEVVLLKFEVL